MRAHDRDCAPHDRDDSELAVIIQIAGSHEPKLLSHDRDMDRERPSNILRLRQYLLAIVMPDVVTYLHIYFIVIIAYIIMFFIIIVC